MSFNFHLLVSLKQIKHDALKVASKHKKYYPDSTFSFEEDGLGYQLVANCGDSGIRYLAYYSPIQSSDGLKNQYKIVDQFLNAIDFSLTQQDREVV